MFNRIQLQRMFARGKMELRYSHKLEQKGQSYWRHFMLIIIDKVKTAYSFEGENMIKTV